MNASPREEMEIRSVLFKPSSFPCSRSGRSRSNLLRKAVRVFIKDPAEGIEMNAVRKVPMECSRCGSNRVNLGESLADDDIVSCAECDEFLGVWFMLRDRLEASARKRAAIDPALMANQVIKQLDAQA